MNEAMAENVKSSEQLSANLADLTLIERTYDSTHRQFLLQLIDTLNSMEECDPNRWNGPLASNTFEGIGLATVSSNLGSPARNGEPTIDPCLCLQ